MQVDQKLDSLIGVAGYMPKTINQTVISDLDVNNLSLDLIHNSAL